MGFANRETVIELEGVFPQEEIPTTEMDPPLNDAPYVTFIEVVHWPETNVALVGKVH